VNKGRMPLPACGPFVLALLLAGCGDQTAPSAEENEQLENAAEMLDSAPGELANINDNALGEAEGNSLNMDEPKR
jgi:PBP1b-binding outer membrane lipoprotein LpoB